MRKLYSRPRVLGDVQGLSHTHTHQHNPPTETPRSRKPAQQLQQLPHSTHTTTRRSTPNQGLRTNWATKLELTAGDAAISSEICGVVRTPSKRRGAKFETDLCRRCPLWSKPSPSVHSRIHCRHYGPPPPRHSGWGRGGGVLVDSGGFWCQKGAQI